MARMSKGRGASAASRGRHCSRPLAHFSPAASGPRLGLGVRTGPSHSPPRAHLSGPCDLSVSPGWPTLSLAPDSPAHPRPSRTASIPLPPAPGPPAPSALTARSGARTRHRRRRAVGGPESRPAPPSAPPHLKPELEPYPLLRGSPALSDPILQRGKLSLSSGGSQELCSE